MLEALSLIQFSQHSRVTDTMSYPCFIVREVEAQRGKVICPIHTLGGKGSQELNISLLNCKASALSTMNLLLYGVCLLNGETSTTCQIPQIIYSNILVLQIWTHWGPESYWTCPKSPDNWRRSQGENTGHSQSHIKHWHIGINWKTAL